MAANSKGKKIEEIKDFSKDFPVETATVNPVPANGKKIKVKFNGLVCGDFGTFYPGAVAEIPEARAKELVKAKVAEAAE